MVTDTTLPLIEPDWPAPREIRAFTTTRRGGVSVGPFADFNLAEHVGDAPAAVGANRQRLRAALGLPSTPHWLMQVHGTTVIPAEPGGPPVRADGAITTTSRTVCAMLTADCLPVLLCDKAGSCVAALHAGWRGLANGIIGAGIQAMPRPPGDLLAWIGPGISAARYEVGDDVRDCLVRANGEYADCFRRNGARWNCDLRGLCERELLAQGVSSIYHCRQCTFEHPEKFFSYRRERTTGRMASLIWIDRA
jgi:hypothetical protein